MKLENGDSIIQTDIYLEHRQANGTLIESWLFNPETDWFDVWNTQCLIIQEKNMCMIAKVFDLYTGIVLCERNLTFHFPRKTLIRGWITKEGVLISPQPDYMKSLMVTYIPHANKYMFYESYKTLVEWCTHIHVTKEGDHFVMYDYEDDQTVIFSLPDLKMLKSSRSAFSPTGIERVGNKLICSTSFRWDNSKTDTVEVDI